MSMMENLTKLLGDINIRAFENTDSYIQSNWELKSAALIALPHFMQITENLVELHKITLTYADKSAKGKEQALQDIFRMNSEIHDCIYELTELDEFHQGV